MATSRVSKQTTSTEKTAENTSDDASKGEEMSAEMGLESKLQLLDQEIRMIQEFCKNRGYDPWQIEKCAQPLFEVVSQNRRKRWLRRLVKVAIMVVLGVLLVHFDPAYRLMCAYGKRASVQVLPYWDWTRMYDEECLVNNPYFKGNELMEEDCEVCETLEEIRRISNVSHTVMAEDFLKRDIPVIVTDGIEHWEAKEKFNLHFLDQLYHQEDSLKDIMPCMFASNVRTKYGNAKNILRKGAKGEISNWYAHWENCEKHAAKFMRQFYGRPYFVPPMVEIAETNWVFIASYYRAKRPKPADIVLPMVFYSQLRGEVKMQLTPRTPCNSTCPTLYTTLHEGETLVFTDMMWLLDYMPLGSPETLAIGSGGYFD